MAKKIDIKWTPNTQAEFEMFLESSPWAWLEQELSKELGDIVEHLAFGNLQFDNPQEFWELRARARAIKLLLKKPKDQLRLMTEGLQRKARADSQKKLDT